MADFGGLSRRLISQTVATWWALFPQLLTLQLLMWLVMELAFRVVSLVINVSGWLALGLFGLAFLIMLAMIVLQMRLVSNHVGGRRLVPSELREVQSRVHDDRFGRFLGLTILPFLCIYGVFGELDDNLRRLTLESLALQGVWSGDSLVQQIQFLPLWPRGVILVVVLLVLFSVRRALELANDATTLRLFGYAAAVFETMFVLTLLMLAKRMWAFVDGSFATTRAAAWAEALHDRLSRLLPWLPDALDAAGRAVGVIGAVGTVVLVLPALWFALAGLVHGSKVLSLADLWQAGVPPRMALRALVRRQAPVGSGGSRTVRDMALSAQELLFGDLDDKYIPALQAALLFYRAGGIFLAALTVCHTVLHVIHDTVLPWLAFHLLGGHTFEFWFRFAPMLVDLPIDLLVEPLRITLMSVAFVECLRRVHARSVRAGGAAGVPA